jgi:uncharacterized protein YwqG
MIFGRKKGARGHVRDAAKLTTGLERLALQVVKGGGPSRSYFGGDPQLPPDLRWPHRNGAKLRFLARLSLQELQATEITAWLPQSGALLFFYDEERQPWGFDPADRGGWAVLHVPDVSLSSTTSREKSAGELPCSSVTLRRIHVFPSSGRSEVRALNLSGDEFDKYIELSDQQFQGLPKHQMLGLPSPVQGDAMELECQLASNGLYCGTPDAYASAPAKLLEDGAKNWRLLFQMDSDDDLGVMWGDVGTIYFWVEESAARKGDFSNVWLVLQCC